MLQGATATATNLQWPITDVECGSEKRSSLSDAILNVQVGDLLDNVGTQPLRSGARRAGALLLDTSLHTRSLIDSVDWNTARQVKSRPRPSEQPVKAAARWFIQVS